MAAATEQQSDSANTATEQQQQQQLDLVDIASDYMSGCSHRDMFICDLTCAHAKKMTLPELLAVLRKLLTKCHTKEYTCIGWSDNIVKSILVRLPINRLFLKDANPDAGVRHPILNKEAQEFLVKLDPLDAQLVLFYGEITSLESFDEQNRTEAMEKIFRNFPFQSRAYMFQNFSFF
jgi:hypothetical protein